MALSTAQRWLLYAPPIIVLGGLAIAWIAIQYLSGNLGWLFPVGDGPMPAVNEAVMKPNMKIIVRAPSGEMAITAGRGLKRSFTWDGGTRSIELWPRKGRWNGSLGAYFPGPGEHWLQHSGIVRCVADEGRLNFDTIEKASEFLAETPALVPRIHRNDGLTIWLSKQGRTLGVGIFQIYINGQKPVKLAGAQDDKIEVLSE